MVEVIALVAELRYIRQHYEPMREYARNKELLLEMKHPQHPFCLITLVVLHKHYIKTRFRHITGRIGFHEVVAGIIVYGRLITQRQEIPS